jgi:hypothetical protein
MLRRTLALVRQGQATPFDSLATPAKTLLEKKKPFVVRLIFANQKIHQFQ